MKVPRRRNLPDPVFQFMKGCSLQEILLDIVQIIALCKDKGIDQVSHTGDQQHPEGLLKQIVYFIIHVQQQGISLARGYGFRNGNRGVMRQEAPGGIIGLRRSRVRVHACA